MTARGLSFDVLGDAAVFAVVLGLDVAEMATIIATDSLEQTRAYASPFFLQGSGHERGMIELSDIVAAKAPGRKTAEDITLFCSVGLAGTEVAVASAIFDSL